jgi:hypothetical protein
MHNRHFGTNCRYRHQIQGVFIFNMGPTGCAETSLMNYHNLLRNGPEERSLTREIVSLSSRTLHHGVNLFG